MTAEIVPFFRCTCSGGAIPLEHCPLHTKAFALWWAEAAKAGMTRHGSKIIPEEVLWRMKPPEDDSGV